MRFGSLDLARRRALEKDFEEEMWSLYFRAGKECGYRATAFRNMLDSGGGVEAAHRILRANKPSRGFTRLWEYGRLDLAVECVALQPRFRSLFDRKELKTAEERLRAMGFDPADCRRDAR